MSIDEMMQAMDADGTREHVGAFLFSWHGASACSLPRQAKDRPRKRTKPRRPFATIWSIGDGSIDVDEWLTRLGSCAGLAAALAENVNEQGELSNFVAAEPDPEPAPALEPATDVGATKAKTRGALLGGLKSGALEVAVAKMEEDTAAEEEVADRGYRLNWEKQQNMRWVHARTWVRSSCHRDRRWLPLLPALPLPLLLQPGPAVTCRPWPAARTT
jgi:hypothetical protein